MAEKQARQIAQEEVQKTKKAKNSEKEITNLLGFKKKQAYAQNEKVLQKRAYQALFLHNREVLRTSYYINILRKEDF